MQPLSQFPLQPSAPQLVQPWAISSIGTIVGSSMYVRRWAWPWRGARLAAPARVLRPALPREALVVGLRAAAGLPQVSPFDLAGFLLGQSRGSGLAILLNRLLRFLGIGIRDNGTRLGAAPGRRGLLPLGSGRETAGTGQAETESQQPAELFCRKRNRHDKSPLRISKSAVLVAYQKLPLGMPNPGRIICLRRKVIGIVKFRRLRKETLIRKKLAIRKVCQSFASKEYCPRAQ